MQVCNTKELAEELGITQARISQMKSQGRFDGCFAVNRNKIEWDKEAAVKAYREGNPLASVSPTRRKSEDLEIPTFNESRAKSEHFRAELARLIWRSKRISWWKWLVYSGRLSLLLVLYGMLWVIFLTELATSWLRSRIRLSSTRR